MDLLIAWMWASQLLGSVSAGGFAVLGVLVVAIGGPVLLLMGLDKWRKQRRKA